MTHPFELDIEAIKKEAQEAAFFHDNINAACPYPFATMAGAVFKEAFLAAQTAMDAAANPARKVIKITPRQPAGGAAA